MFFTCSVCRENHGICRTLLYSLVKFPVEMINVWYYNNSEENSQFESKHQLLIKSIANSKNHRAIEQAKKKGDKLNERNKAKTFSPVNAKHKNGHCSMFSLTFRMRYCTEFSCVNSCVIYSLILSVEDDRRQFSYIFLS